MEAFCLALPKIELHAHLNGSLSDSTLMQLKKLNNEDGGTADGQAPEFKIIQGRSRTLSKCLALFKTAHDLTQTPEAVRLATTLTLEEFDRDNVVYVELRSTPRDNSNMTKEQYIQSMIDAVIECSKRLKMKTFLLISIDRRNTIEQATETVSIAIEMSKRYPGIILGLDLSGDPKVASFGDFANILDTGRKAGLGATIHTAEVEADEETLEIIQWAPDRLGHVSCVTEDLSNPDSLWNTLLKSKIPIELCLSSNVKTGAVKSYSDHHFQRLYKIGHPICLATDDKGVFDTQLSAEFNLCATTFGLTKQDLWTLAFGATDFILAPETIKKNLIETMLNAKPSLD